MRKINIQKSYWIIILFLGLLIVGFLFTYREGINIEPDSKSSNTNNAKESSNISKQKCNNDGDCNQFIPGVYDYNINVKFTGDNLTINRLQKTCIDNVCK